MQTRPCSIPIAFGHGAGQLVFVAGSWQVLTGPAGRVGHPTGVGLEALGLLDHELLEVPAMDVLGLEEGGHGIAAKEGQVAAKGQAVKAGESPLDGVRVFGDELVHSRIAHELRRESPPLASPANTPAQLRIFDPERHPILPPDAHQYSIVVPAVNQLRCPVGLVAAARPRCAALRASGSPAPRAQLDVTPFIRRHRPPPTPWAVPRARLQQPTPPSNNLRRRQTEERALVVRL